MARGRVQAVNFRHEILAVPYAVEAPSVVT